MIHAKKPMREMSEVIVDRPSDFGLFAMQTRSDPPRMSYSVRDLRPVSLPGLGFGQPRLALHFQNRDKSDVR